MCLTVPGRVIAVDAEGATVDVDGRELRASTLLEPEVAVGDRVIVMAGAIVRRLTEAEAADLEAGARAAYDDTAPLPDLTPRTPEEPEDA